MDMAAKKSPIEEVKAKHEMRLLGIEAMEGVGISEEAGHLVIKVYVSKKTKALQKSIPARIEGYPVRIEVSGEFHALPK